MLIFIGAIANVDYLLLAIMAHRVVLLIGDILAYGVAICCTKRKQKQ
jgi:hypothetical protein